MNEAQAGKKHTLMLDNRKKLVITGAEDVSGFNEETVSLKTSAGGLIIRGSDLRIDRLNLETGDVTVEGTVNSLQYTGGAGKSRFSGLFR